MKENYLNSIFLKGRLFVSGHMYALKKKTDLFMLYIFYISKHFLFHFRNC